MNKKLTISGIAVKEGISRNKRKYIAKELEKFTPSMIDRPILKDHEGVTDNVIGKITEAIYDENTKSVKYSGWIKEDGTGIIDKIKDGRIKEVSIGALAGKVVKENKDDDIIIPTDMEALELSTTPVPGNKGTSIAFENKKYTSEELNEMISEYEKEAQITGMETKRKQMGMSVSQFYAAPRDPPSSSALPIFDASHVRNAMARFNQTHFNNPGEKRRAHAAIMRAAKKFKIDVSNFESISQSYDIIDNDEKEDMSMENPNSNISGESNQAELKELKATIESLKADNEALEKEKAELLENQRKSAIKAYKKLCESKGIKAKDLSEADMTMIKFATEMVEELPEAEDEKESEEEKPEDKAKEAEAEDKSSEDEKASEEKVTKKPIAETKSKTAKVDKEVTESFEGYAITTEDVNGGVALYKHY